MEHLLWCNHKTPTGARRKWVIWSRAGFETSPLRPNTPATRASKILAAKLTSGAAQSDDRSMKVTRNIPEQLIIADTPWLIGIMLILFILAFVGAGLIIVISGEWTGFLFGLAGGGMGGAAFALFVRRTQAIFHRGTGQVTIRTRSVFGFSEETHPLSEVERAEVESSRNSDGQFTHRPVLIMLGEARVPVMDVYSSGGGATRLVAAINDWLGEGRTGTAAAE